MNEISVKNFAFDSIVIHVRYQKQLKLSQHIERVYGERQSMRNFLIDIFFVFDSSILSHIQWVLLFRYLSNELSYVRNFDIARIIVRQIRGLNARISLPSSHERLFKPYSKNIVILALPNYYLGNLLRIYYSTIMDYIYTVSYHQNSHILLQYYFKASNFSLTVRKIIMTMK